MDVPLKHVIGTVALIGLVIAVGLSYAIVTSYIEAEVTRKQLEQIAENVSLNIVEIVNMVDFANFLTKNAMMKILELPSDLGGKAYMIKLADEKMQGKGYCVYAQLVTRPDISARSPLPINSTQTRLIVMTENEDVRILPVKGETNMIYCSPTVYGGNNNIVVWGWKPDADTTWAGIGLWKPMEE